MNWPLVSAIIAVVPLPGAMLITALIVFPGLHRNPLRSLALPRKGKELTETVAQLALKLKTIIFYEAPHRLKRRWQALINCFAAKRQVTLGRELTKKFEEFIRGDLQEALTWATDNEMRGEFVIIVAGTYPQNLAWWPPIRLYHYQNKSKPRFNKG